VKRLPSSLAGLANVALVDLQVGDPNQNPLEALNADSNLVSPVPSRNYMNSAII
jgi:hypothetical protein